MNVLKLQHMHTHTGVFTYSAWLDLYVGVDTLGLTVVTPLFAVLHLWNGTNKTCSILTTSVTSQLYHSSLIKIS